jgi:hypothetical protein
LSGSLVVLRVHAGGRGIEELADTGVEPVFEGAQVDRGGVVRDVRVMLSGEQVSNTIHIRCKLVDLIDVPNDIADDVLIPKIGDQELIDRNVGEFVRFEVDGANPKAFGLETLYEVTADEPTGSVNKNTLHDGLAPCKASIGGSWKGLGTGRKRKSPPG